MVSSVSSRRKRYLKHYNASTWTQSSSVLVIPKNKVSACFFRLRYQLLVQSNSKLFDLELFDIVKIQFFRPRHYSDKELPFLPCWAFTIWTWKAMASKVQRIDWRMVMTEVSKEQNVPKINRKSAVIHHSVNMPSFFSSSHSARDEAPRCAWGPNWCHE